MTVGLPAPVCCRGGYLLESRVCHADCRSSVSECSHSCLTELSNTETGSVEENTLEPPTGEGTEEMPSKTSTETQSKNHELLVFFHLDMFVICTFPFFCFFNKRKRHC